jgi:fatty acid desaturase
MGKRSEWDQMEGFIIMLTTVFIALTLIGVISWALAWALPPLWIAAILGLTVCYDAWDAYQNELKKLQEERPND